jgi:hypothetical protein
VSNSGRLKALIHDTASAAGWNVAMELVFNRDRVRWESEEDRRVRRRRAESLPAMGESDTAYYLGTHSAIISGEFVARR